MARHLISKEKIIEAALSSAFEKSMGATSLADISTTLEIKKASLYNHFESKDEILKAVYTYCSDYYQNVNFITQEMMDNIKQGAEKILKNAVERYFIIHEKDPLYGIYIFINSEKYFTPDCLNIFISQKNKIETEVFLLLKTDEKNCNAKNTADSKLKALSKYFCNTILSMMDSYLSMRKETIRQNPECGAGSLFALPSDDKALAEAKDFVKAFIANKNNCN